MYFLIVNHDDTIECYINPLEIIFIIDWHYHPMLLRMERSNILKYMETILFFMPSIYANNMLVKKFYTSFIRIDSSLILYNEPQISY
jgi:hypothetical protein